MILSLGDKGPDDWDFRDSWLEDGFCVLVLVEDVVLEAFPGSEGGFLSLGLAPELPALAPGGPAPPARAPG